MPALRSGHPAMLPRSRRRSSHLALFMPAKPGIYGVGIQQPLPSNSPSTPPSALSRLPPRPISFAPNVTPVTFVESEDSSSPSTPEPLSPNSQPKLFPPSETPAPPPARKRCPPGKRRSQGYIPRPPNAFMLFRADFVRQKHVPGSIETNHGSLSKIIGNCWRSLPVEEKKVWDMKAKQEKAAHKQQYPNYRFRPIHNKKKNKDASSRGVSKDPTSEKKKHEQTMEEEYRSEMVTQLLLQGKKGEELAQEMRRLENPTPPQIAVPSRSFAFDNGIMSAPQPTYPTTSMLTGSNGNFFNAEDSGTSSSYLHLRRSSSVPLPGAYTNGGFDFNNFNSNFNVGGGMSLDYYMHPPPPPYSESQHESNSGIAIPSVPFLPPPSSSGISGIANSSLNRDAVDEPSSHLNITSISKKQQRMLLGHRRSSSAGPVFGGIHRSWAAPFNTGASGYGYGYFDNQNADGNIVLQRDDSPLPEVDLSLFDPNFLNGSSGVVSQPVPALEDPAGPHSNPGTTHTTPNTSFNVAELKHGLPSMLGPLDTTGFQGPTGMMSPHDMASPAESYPASESYWSSSSSMYHTTPQQQQQGLGLEVGPTEVAPDATTSAIPPDYDQMYLAEQSQHSLGIEMGYANAGSYNYGPLDMGNSAQYVEC